MNANEALLLRPAHELAELVRAGEITARELTEAALEKIERLDPEVGAFTDVDADTALAAADTIGRGDPRLLAGVPLAIKNNRAVTGLPSRSGSKVADGLVSPYDHHTTMRLRREGAVIVGTTALPEWGFLPTTEAQHRPPTRNPWDLSRTPGGSSGGAAAAVASGMLPIAHGNDGGGSIRIPAAACGLVGLKPARGRVSQGPETGESFIVVDAALTRTIADSALALDALAGPELGDASWAPPHTESYRSAIERDPGKLRVGLWRVPPINGAELDPEHLAAVDAVAEQLAALGHEIVEGEIALPVDGNVLSAMFVDLFTDMGSIQQRLLGVMGKGGPLDPSDVEPLSWAIAEKAAGRSATDAWVTKISLEALSRMTIGAFSPYDVVLSPALVTPPPKIGWITGALEPDPLEAFTRAERFMAFSPFANVTGLPAISLPTHQSSEGLPIGVQLMGRACEEHVLLQVGAQLERELRWDQRLSPMATSG